MSKLQDFIHKWNYLFWSLSIRPWASYATCLYVEPPLENIEKINIQWLANMALVLNHTRLELGMFDVAGKLLFPTITL